MAQRPIFSVDETKEGLITEKLIEFEYFTGFSRSQKEKSINSLHKAAKLEEINSILEVSTKSPSQVGVLLSAFNLSFLSSENKQIFLESAFQGSKIYENNDGPHTDLYNLSPSDVKKDIRIDRNKKIIGFQYNNIFWNTEPKTAFYDWLYLNALKFNIENSGNPIYKEVLNYSSFTDIEFNHKKSINCQARSCALYVSLEKKNLLTDALKSKESFLEILSIDSFYNAEIEKNSYEQKVFFD